MRAAARRLARVPGEERMPPRRPPRVLYASLLIGLLAAGVARAAADAPSERAEVDAWRAARLESLTSDTGWLTLAGLLWLAEGRNSFGRAADNTLVLENPALAAHAGSFEVAGGKVRFLSAPGAHVTHAGEEVRELELASDATGEPTVLASGALRFFVIERAGRLAVRVRDLDNPHRKDFRGLEYFPVDAAWSLEARFEAYVPARRLKIVNVLGMEEEVVSPGAVVFAKDGREWRLDTVLEAPDDPQLFIMFADGTSGTQTYGGGRFLYIPLPDAGRARVDFNKAENPPCALNDFATCPLPPPQNRLTLRIEAGEEKYRGAAQHAP
jgi:uncharacterized protein (DUF1684 family)